MQAYILTNYGKNCATALAKNPTLSRFYNNDVEQTIIATISEESVLCKSELTSKGYQEVQKLERDGLVEKVNGKADDENPIKNLQGVTFELTYDCNAGCNKCYHSDYQRNQKDMPAETVKKIVDIAEKGGVKTFYFHGGEPTLREDILDLINYASNGGKNYIGMVTNGWWGSSNKITAEKLKENGLNFAWFSIDGIGIQHDYYRKIPGLFQSVINAIKTTQEAGIEPMVIYDPKIFQSIGTLQDVLKEHMETVPDIHLGSRVQVGRGVSLRTNALDPVHIDDLKGKECPDFDKPGQIIIRPDGNVGACFFTYGGHEYGNLKEQSLIEILNNIQNTEIFKVTREKRFHEIAKDVNWSLFKEEYNIRCAPLAIALAVNDHKKKYQEKHGLTEDQSKKLANITVAIKYGYM